MVNFVAFQTIGKRGKRGKTSTNCFILAGKSWISSLRHPDVGGFCLKQSVFYEMVSWQPCPEKVLFPKQFTVGVLNATLDLAALVLVGVVGFLGSEVVLSPVVSGCLPSCGGWVLVGAAAFLGSEVVLSPVVSGCLPSCGGWLVWPHLEQKHSEIKITGFNLDLLTVNCLGSTLV